MQQAKITLQQEKVNNLVTSNQTVRNCPSKYNENNSFFWIMGQAIQQKRT